MCKMPSPWKHPDSGIYYLRVEVPEDVRGAIGKRWIKKSLRTRDIPEAKRLFAIEYSKVSALIEQARSRVHLTPKDIEILASRWFDACLSEIEDEGAFELYSVQTDSGLEPVTEFVIDALQSGYEDQLKIVGGFVTEILEQHNLLISEGSEDHRRLTDRVSWRFLELSRIAYARHYGDWSSAPDNRYTARLADSLSIESNPIAPSKRSYKPLSEIAEAYITYKTDRGDWDARTLSEVKSVFGQLVDYLGADTDPSSITREQLREFSSLLLQLPKNYTRTPKLSKLPLNELVEVAADKELPLVSANTVKKKFVFVKSLFKHAAREEWVDKDRAEGITIPKGSEKKRLPYTESELRAIFTATKDSEKPSEFWLPRISLTTGMRKNEILQLTKDDVRLVSDVWCFDVNSNNGKSVKNDNSERLVPVPDVILKAGWLEYVDTVKQGELFTCANSTTFSQRFNRMLDKLGLKPDAGENLLRDFHSFRHTFRANARGFGIAKETADLIGGWRDQEGRTSGDSYGLHFETFIGELKEAIDKIEYKVGFGVFHL